MRILAPNNLTGVQIDAFVRAQDNYSALMDKWHDECDKTNCGVLSEGANKLIESAYVAYEKGLKIISRS
jgi:hypothetical protein